MTTLALIGVGEWGKNYLHAITGLDKAKIKYICAQRQRTLDLLPNRYIKTLSIKDLLKNRQIDGFIIATPASTHFAIAKQFLSSGRNILIDKPLTTNYQHALILKKIWQAKKPKVLVGHTYLYNPAYQEFKKLFNRMQTITSISFEGLRSPIRKDVSVIWDWGPHPISILLDLIRHPVREVRTFNPSNNSYNKLLDTVSATIRFENNIDASVHISWLGPHRIRRLTATGVDTSIELDDTKVPQKKLSLWKLNNHLKYPKYAYNDAPLTKELAEFVAVIKNNQGITSDINMGVNVVRILSAIEESVKRNGQSVPLRRT